MSENCSHNCGSCSSNCSNRKPADFLVAPNPHSSIKKVIGVVSGKGGVGKSMVTSTLAVLTQRKGKQTAILDADITGPSIPKAFGMKEKAYGTELGMMPCKTKTGIDVMSVNLLLDNETDPVVWRGPVIAETVKQFWRDVVWEKEEYQLPVNYSLPDLRGYAGRFDRDGVTTGRLIRKPKICISNLGFLYLHK